ncbi:unnamed protein product [Alopecurus aequalis]
MPPDVSSPRGEEKERRCRPPRRLTEKVTRMGLWLWNTEAHRGGSPRLGLWSGPRTRPASPPGARGEDGRWRAITHRAEILALAPEVQQRRTMDQFHDGHHVWLRSRVHGTYLHADDDGEGASLREGRASLNAAWAVHLFHGDDAPYVLLHSAAYGRYLAATDAKAPRGGRGFRVAQRNNNESEAEDIKWHAVRTGPGEDILLRHDHVVGCGRYHRYLRANGRYLPWNNSVVSVDDSQNFSTMMQWVVEPIPARQGRPGLPRPIRASVVRLGRAVEAWQLIRFVRASDVGLCNEKEGWSVFQFRGRSVYHLRNELAMATGVAVPDLIMCVRAGRYGRLTPLVVDLPRDGSGDTIEIVVIMDGTPASSALRHPDVNAEKRKIRTGVAS